MADESHLSVLKQGSQAWHRWRGEDFGGKPNLSQAKLRKADPHSTDLHEANLRGANLIEADLRKANLEEADLREADLSWADLEGAKLFKADLHEAKLREANLSWAFLGLASLINVNLTGANLSGAFLGKADLRGVNLCGAYLWQVGLLDTKFEGATIGETVFAGIALSSCIGLDSIEHKGPSTLGVDSIIRSNGRIPKAFLRGVGLPDEWIDYIPSLVGDCIQFYSCFISYSSLDKPFAVRLHDALQAKGIRCWLDEKQLLPGQDISRELERGIYLWDKFLLCASKNSLTSWWVEGEIKTTFEKEQALRKERGKPVLKLIPLNLDGYMFTAQWDWGVLANEIRGRVAADFRDWQTDEAKFNDQVNRVIKALRADEGVTAPPRPSRL
jgi:hypothetical protein